MHQVDRITTSNEILYCYVSAGCVNKQLFAIKLPLTEGDNIPACLQLFLLLLCGLKPTNK